MLSKENSGFSNEHELRVRERNLPNNRSSDPRDTIVCCVPSAPVKAVVTGNLEQFLRH